VKTRGPQFLLRYLDVRRQLALRSCQEKDSIDEQQHLSQLQAFSGVRWTKHVDSQHQSPGALSLSRHQQQQLAVCPGAAKNTSTEKTHWRSWGQQDQTGLGGCDQDRGGCGKKRSAERRSKLHEKFSFNDGVRRCY